MNIDPIHGKQSGKLILSGPITDEGALQAVRDLDYLVEEVFYPEIVIEITSEGGLLSALDHLMGAFTRHARAGVRIVTRVPIRACSAAAILVSAGEVREASARAILVYHSARVQETTLLTGREASVISERLTESDGRMIRQLAERTLKAVAPDESPEQVLARLSDNDVIVLNRIMASHEGPSEPVSQIGVLRRLLTECRDKDDPAAIEELLRRLFDIDVAISPYLALEIGLIDRVLDEAAETKSEANPSGPVLAVPQWHSILPGGLVEEAVLRRHVLILGETGSGKTASGVLPLAAALCRAPDRLACALVIDPKRELFNRIRSAAHPDVAVRRFQPDDAGGFCVMGRQVESLRSDLDAGKVLTAAKSILVRSSSLAPNDGLGTLKGKPSREQNPYWPMAGTDMAVAVMAVTLMLMRRGQALESSDLAQGASATDGYPAQLANRFREACASAADGAPGLNAIAAAQWLLLEAFRPNPESSEKIKIFAMELVSHLLEISGLAGEEEEALRRARGYCELYHEEQNGHYMGLFGHAQNGLRDFSDPAVARRLYFGIEPWFCDSRENDLDMSRLVDGDKGPTVLVYQLSGSSNYLCGRALKACFFEAVLDSPKRQEEGGKMPLAAYIADEFHRFVTADPKHGEQSFLDTCRSFGCVCVLACQGLSSMRHMYVESGKRASGEPALDILLTNTATKLFFRTSEGDSLMLLQRIAPLVRGQPIAALRPPAGMKPGECYAVLADGRFERKRLDMLPEADDALTFGADEDPDLWPGADEDMKRWADEARIEAMNEADAIEFWAAEDPSFGADEDPEDPDLWPDHFLP